MLRFLSLCLLLAFGGPVAAQPSAAVEQQQMAEVVWNVMRMDGLMPILRDEAVAQGEEMAADLFPRGGTGLWRDRVRAIHDPARAKELFLQGVAAALPRTNLAEVGDGLVFYRTVFGQRMLALENAARVRMRDPAVEAAARDAFAQAVRRRDPRAVRIARLIRAADLIEPNVVGALNGGVAFSKGFQAGGGFAMPLTDSEIVREAWAKEPRIRADTEAWIGAYLFLAYGVLGDAELDRYTAYAGSAGGLALSRLMFAGFDAMISATSHDMGLAAAAELRGRQL
ncbi:hypothetical protein [Paracoccus sp. S3-43]|uniref:hypothetical protein n=1 Tax=Paracoccus sp. S3-43 TaxID=3030011 RepID=UPI0023AFCD5F|nr:hypothetical protein [Paracoccus sp. S3-43]WEF23108.1 hypothetical protein PXD02_09695 [Paracoccus sp. S3-43]